jgi:hypothetical protein
MPMLNPFATDAFNMVALTAAINKIPNTYGRLEQLNLMPATGVRTRTIIIEEMSGVLNLLPTQPVGAPGTLGTQGKRKVRSFVIPHIPHDDVVLPEEVQGIRAFGSESEMEALADLMAQKLQTMRAKHAITLEHLRMGALKGVILDADGSTLYDLYHEFGITPKDGQLRPDHGLDRGAAQGARSEAAHRGQPQGRVHDRGDVPVLAGLLRRPDHAPQGQGSLPALAARARCCSRQPHGLHLRRGDV